MCGAECEGSGGEGSEAVGLPTALRPGAASVPAVLDLRRQRPVLLVLVLQALARVSRPPSQML